MLNWMVLVWVLIISAVSVLGTFHLLVWLNNRKQWASLLFAGLAAHIAVCGVLELGLMHARTLEEYAFLQRWTHFALVPTAMLLVGYILLTQPARAWLAVLVCAVRVLMAVANFTTGNSLSYLRVDQLQEVSIWGATFSDPAGPVNPWFALAIFGNLLLIAFLTDALLASMRLPATPENLRKRREARAILAFATLAIVSYAVTVLSGVVLPVMATIPFFAVALVINHHLMQDAIEAPELRSALVKATTSAELSQSDLALAEQAAGLGLWRWEPEQDRIWLSVSAARAMGHLSEGYFDGARVVAVVDTEDLQRLRHAFAAARAIGLSDVHAEFRVHSADSSTRWFAMQAKLDYAADGRFRLARGVLIDATSQRAAQESFRQVFDASPAAMLLVSGEGRIRLANPRAAVLTGYAGEDLIDLAVDELVPLDLRNAHAGHRHGYAQSGTARVMSSSREVGLLRKDGTLVDVEVALNPTEIDKERMVIAVISDISERRSREREVVMQQAALAHLARVGLMADLSGSLAHELNQPLTAILSNAQASARFATHEPPNLGEIREALTQIIESSKRAGEVIRRLRAMLRNDAPEFIPLDLSEVIRDVLQIIQSELLDRNIAIVTDLAAELPLVLGDRVQLQQVFMNLLVNAADAMEGQPSGRRISLRTRAVEEGVLIEVEDVGKGIPEADLERIFKPFVSSKPGGLGFGLALCTTLIKAHHGRLWASNNQPGPGSTLHVWLPSVGESE